MKISIETKEDAVDVLHGLLEFLNRNGDTRYSRPPTTGLAHPAGAATVPNTRRGVPSPNEPLILEAIKKAGKPLTGQDLADALTHHWPGDERPVVYRRVYAAARYMEKNGKLIYSEGGFRLP